MDLSVLLMTASISAGVNMMLFFVAASVAVLYYKRFKKLQRQIAQDAEAFDQDAEPSEPSVQRPSNASSNRARMERRQRRRREEFRRQVQEGISNLSDIPSRVENRGAVELRPLPPKTAKEPKKDTRGEAMTA